MSNPNYQRFETTQANIVGTIGREGVYLIYKFNGEFTCGVKYLLTDWSEGTYTQKGSMLPVTAREDVELNNLLDTSFNIFRNGVPSITESFATFSAEFTMPMRREMEGTSRHDRTWSKPLGEQKIKIPFWHAVKEQVGLSPSARELYRILSKEVRRTLIRIDCQKRRTQGILNRSNILFKRQVNPTVGERG